MGSNAADRDEDRQHPSGMAAPLAGINDPRTVEWDTHTRWSEADAGHPAREPGVDR
jgi:hypothetical protein